MLDKINLKLKLTKEEYHDRLRDLQVQLFDSQRRCWEANLGVVIAFEGWELAGKGAVIKKLTERMEPRAYEIHVVRGRRTHEKPLPWLYRFWAALPSYGRFAIFDRSWNRRILVHGIDGSLTDSQYQRAFDDIKFFEGALATDRYAVIKFFMHIDREEQLRRLEKYSEDETESWRLQPHDWEQNERFDEHLAVAEEMLARTETEWAPWTIVEATDIRWARIKVIETVIDRLEEALELRAQSDAAENGNGAS